MLETRYVWAPTLAEAMEYASGFAIQGWRIEGNPAPMIWDGQYGTGVSLTRICND